MRGSMPLVELAAADPSARLSGEPQTRIGGIAYDVREVRSGDLFAALDGDEFRGHDLVPAAVERGAAALLVGRDPGLEVPLLLTESPRASLARLAAAFHGHPSRALPAVGITGTDGKTTTVSLLEAV